MTGFSRLLPNSAFCSPDCATVSLRCAIYTAAARFKSIFGKWAPVRAGQVHLVDSALEWHDEERRSSRTGQTHPLGGFTGTVTYEGDLAEFLPWLKAGYWTGVGRQTVWGKGLILLPEEPPR